MGSLSKWMNCPEVGTYIGNLTSSYKTDADKSNELSMVAASVIMFMLASLFFILNLFSGISDVSAILDPKVRVFLSSALSLFLPVMSYLFSEAKNAAGYSYPDPAGAKVDLSLRAGLILVWMLLVELLRKKVDAIRMRGYSGGTVQRAGRVVWLGSLVFFNIRSAGRKALFSILWILCATKLLQRIAFTEVGKRSYAHGKNARLISSYMSHILDEQEEPATGGGNGNELLRKCDYIVMGEDDMKGVIEPTAQGYKLVQEDDKKRTTSSSCSITCASDDDDDDDSSSSSIKKLKEKQSIVVTVGEVWKLIDDDDNFPAASPKHAESLRRLCLSFALFKLLRRRFEHLPAMPMTDKQEARNSWNLILNGLYKSGGGGSPAAEAVFQVMNDEINFLCEYYHSVIPVVLASPFFLLVNYVLVNIAVAFLCLTAVILCANGDIRYALDSLSADNYTLQAGVFRVAMCLVLRSTDGQPATFFSLVALSITIFLFVIFLYEEIWEFFVFLLSNWFMVSLIYNYKTKPRWLRRNNAAFRAAFRTIVWLRRCVAGEHHKQLSMNQLSVLNLHWPPMVPLLFAPMAALRRTKLVPKKAKEGIMHYLVELGPHGTPPTKGKSALPAHQHLAWACKSNSVAKVILTWHIATGILEVKGAAAGAAAVDQRKVAIRLSEYCAYLVAFHRELLPGNPEKAERVFEDIRVGLKDMLGFWGYYLLLPRRRRAEKIMAWKPPAAGTTGGDLTPGQKIVKDGVRLANSLIAMERAADDGPAAVWKVLADVWTELVVYLAPSSDEERVKVHEDILVQGGEFITVLWALTTHIGVSRNGARAGAAATA